MKKTLNLVLSIMLILASMSIRVFAEGEKFDLETSLELQASEMMAGEENHLIMGLKTSGPKTVVKDLTLRLEFDEMVTLNQTFLEKNIPSFFEYDIKDDHLLLTVKKLEAGKFYEIPVLFKTKNGLTQNNRVFEFKLSGEAKDYYLETKTASVIVKASSPLKINKDYRGLAEESLEDSLGIAPGLTGRWHTKALIPKSEYGQMFIQEGSKIVILEQYDHEILDYVGIKGVKEPELVEEGLLKWVFDAPSYEEQKRSKHLFFEEFDVIYRVKSDLQLDHKIDDIGAEVSLQFQNIEGVDNMDEDEGKTSIYPSSSDTPQVQGRWWIPGHFGPSDAFGEFSTDFEEMNVRPTVYEWAKLSYAHQIAALDYGEYDVYKSYKISYFINKHLVLDEIKTPGRFSYRPNREHGDATYLEKQPSLDVLFYDENEEVIKRYQNIEQNQVIKREDILEGKDPQTRIAKVVYDVTDFVPGMIVDEPKVNPNTGVSDLPTYTFSISPSWKDDAVDNYYVLKNEKIIEVERQYPSGYKETYDFREDVEYDYIVDNDGEVEGEWMGWHFLSAPRWAIVTEEEETYVPTVTNPIEFIKHQESVVYPGENTLRLTFNNLDVSSGATLNDLVSYFILPKTVQLDHETFDQIRLIEERDYHNLYELKWSNDLLVPRQSLTQDFPVTIEDTLESLDLAHYTNLVNNEDFKVPKVDEPVLQDSLKVLRPDSLADYLEEKDIVLSKNHYRVLQDYFVEVEKFVKAPSDKDFLKTTVMKEEDEITYRLDFSNKKGTEVDRFALMDVLPHIGDQGISNFVERGSEFNLSLSSPVQIDDRFDVFYSPSQNPSRKPLNDWVDREHYLELEGGEEIEWLEEADVEDWGSIYSFLVVLKEGEKIEIDESFTLIFNASIPQDIDYKEDVYAHNSFALTANGSPVIEPLQVSVKLELEEVVEPEEPKPEEPKPEEPKPEEPKPEEPKPEEPKPEEPKPEEPKPEEPKPEKPKEEAKQSDDVKPKDPALPSTGQNSLRTLSFSILGIGLLIYLRSLSKRRRL